MGASHSQDKFFVFVWEVPHKLYYLTHSIIIKDLYGHTVTATESDDGTYLFKFYTDVPNPIQLMKNFYFTISIAKVEVHNDKERRIIVYKRKCF